MPRNAARFTAKTAFFDRIVEQALKDLTSADMHEKYLSVGGDSEVGKVPSLFWLVYATVTRKK